MLHDCCALSLLLSEELREANSEMVRVICLPDPQNGRVHDEAGSMPRPDALRESTIPAYESKAKPVKLLLRLSELFYFSRISPRRCNAASLRYASPGPKQPFVTDSDCLT